MLLTAETCALHPLGKETTAEINSLALWLPCLMSSYHQHSQKHRGLKLKPPLIEENTSDVPLNARQRLV